MITWEYRTLLIATQLGTWLDQLNALGADGWEVVGRDITEERSVLLRRPAPAAAGMVTGD
ncbi:hypothetical protein [Blastococcus sp. TF02A-35]|uniref:hypothetical protein n=1 Tax=Blastococcus sp. TF02A-35 TaxID=2559612 RepID=UPI001073E9F2|nr:hypothetical protein [Blastococcus sp. TF02A_35]TFV49539.1 hypothetical protein E4P43_11870 [Blastococcus sp. TF02A_35]